MPLELLSKIKPKMVLVALISVAWVSLQLYIALVVPLHPMLQTPVHLIFALAIVFLYRPFNKDNGPKWMKAVDVVLLLGLAFMLYYFISEASRITTRVPYISPLENIDFVIMVMCIVILLEAVRRVLGAPLLILILIVIVYMWFGQYFPGIFRFGGTNLRRFTDLMTMGTQGIFGVPLGTSVSVLFYFIMFGALFSACGGGKVLLDIGMRFSKNSTGGPAKAAVISSSLVGMLSGSAVANVATTGPMTIPMMKKVGYTPEEAGAIEAVASTGGQILPPIMGVGAFIMAEMLGIPYRVVAVSAIIPAVAYYLSIFFLVTFMAKRRDAQRASQPVALEGLEVAFDPILPRLYLLIPAGVLVYFMLQGTSLMRSALFAIYATILINFANKFLFGGKHYLPLKGLWKALLQGMKQAADIAVPTAACGIIIGSVIQSGLAPKISALISSLGLTHLPLALLITMVGCMVIGLALPAVAAYLISAILFVPTLTGLGIPPLPANMFVFYFGIMAQITPPVAVASFTAAGIAGANAMKTSWKGLQFALVAFLVPFAFVYEPGILLMDTVPNIIRASMIVFIGSFLLAAGMAGFLRISLRMPERVILVIGAILVIVPETISTVIGIGIGLTLLILCTIRKKKMNAAEASSI